MRSTADKIETLRTATAVSGIRAAPAIIDALMQGTTPKGNALEIARAAAILAAKRTWELIPYCHPIPIDQVTIDFTQEADGIAVQATVTAVAKTGVEMEALTAAMIAALTLYDMGKSMKDTITIDGCRLVEKRGGQSDWREAIPNGFRAAVVVTSDGTASGAREDRSGQLIRERLVQYGVPVATYRILPDEREQIIATLLALVEEGHRLILTTGGTGLGPRDVTVEATSAVIEREVPGIAEAMRGFGQRRTPYAMLSRGLVGARGKCIIANLPGSSRGVKESLDAIFPAILHVIPMMEGGGHRG